MIPATRFTCYICAEPSTDICRYCTKDTCGNHLCEKCLCCSDCCRCEMHRVSGAETEHNHPNL